MSRCDSVQANVRGGMKTKCDAMKSTTQRQLSRAVSASQERKQLSELSEAQSKIALHPTSSTRPRDGVSLAEAVKIATTHFHKKLVSLPTKEKEEFEKLWRTTLLELSWEAVTPTTVLGEKIHASSTQKLRGDYLSAA